MDKDPASSTWIYFLNIHKKKTYIGKKIIDYEVIFEFLKQ